MPRSHALTSHQTPPFKTGLSAANVQKRPHTPEGPLTGKQPNGKRSFTPSPLPNASSKRAADGTSCIHGTGEDGKGGSRTVITTVRAVSDRSQGLCKVTPTAEGAAHLSAPSMTTVTSLANTGHFQKERKTRHHF